MINHRTNGFAVSVGRFARFLLAALVLPLCGQSPSTAQPAASSAIEARLMAEFDRPQARLTVAPIAISGEYAVAGWRQEGRGGRALLRRRGHEWRIVMCAGEALRREPALIQIGLSTEDARVITATLAVEEGRLGTAHVAALDSFEGQVTMDGAGHHPPAGSHGAHGSHH